jgi:hypothetical protein
MAEKNAGSSIDKLVVISGRMKNNQKRNLKKKGVRDRTILQKRMQNKRFYGG